MRVYEGILTMLGGAAAAAQGRPSVQGDQHTRSLMELPLSDICNQGRHWQVPANAGDRSGRSALPLRDDDRQLHGCLQRRQAHGLPDARAEALCLQEQAVAACEAGDDPWCLRALGRHAKRALEQRVHRQAPGPLHIAVARTLPDLQDVIQRKARNTYEYQQILLRLESAYFDLIESDPARLPLGVAGSDLLGRVRELDRVEPIGSRAMQRFDWALRAAGAALHPLLQRTGHHLIDARPEHYATALGPELDEWLNLSLPQADGRAISDLQRDHVTGLLAAWLNRH